MKKIAVITSTRAEYGLLHPLIERMRSEDSIEMQLLVSGTHLLERFGNTIQYIREDGIPIAYEIPILEEDFISDEVHVAGVIARAAEQTAAVFASEKYDAVVVLGDRYELLGFCSAAVVCRVPIIHIHGGEITEGAIDDKIRHAITKLASIHFPSVQEYADRIIQMGEAEGRVFPVGALGIDNIKKCRLLTKEELMQEIDVDTDRRIAAVTYHPVTARASGAALEEIEEVLAALIESELFSVITMPNSDVGGDVILEKITEYVKKYPKRMVLKKSLGQARYLSLLKNADIMVGNSSSGILESASFLLPTVNIGDRQKGRMAPKNVIHCSCDREEIKQKIAKGLSVEFSNQLVGYVSPYGDGNTAERIVNIIKEIDFSDPSLLCKQFIDIG